jgi:hypothetical protein
MALSAGPVGQYGLYGQTYLRGTSSIGLIWWQYQSPAPHEATRPLDLSKLPYFGVTPVVKIEGKFSNKKWLSCRVKGRFGKLVGSLEHRTGPLVSSPSTATPA